jgi:hypothetical protein
MPEAKHTASQKRMRYATKADFCRVFAQDMSSLYLLSFLLTASREKAEQCFVSGLEDSAKGNPVFEEWARSWARRTIIQNAVRMINPRPGDLDGRSNSASTDNNRGTLPDQVRIPNVLALGSFERFVFVMSVLEHYSDQDCTVLLGCARRDVLAARTRALQEIGHAGECHDKQQVNSRSEQPLLHENRGAIVELEITSHLARSA